MEKIVITGAAGLVGLNLVTRLKKQAGLRLVAIDKHAANVAILRRLHPDIEVIEADLSEAGAWQAAFAGSDAVVMCHAQIGGVNKADFIRNNVVATGHAIAAARAAGIRYLVHISSSVINSQAVDFYTETKKEQEELVSRCGIPSVVLRPTLMFGWYDRKHLGWLRRFMARSPIFPIPGDGAYIRQPLYVGDFVAIILACLAGRRQGSFDISGLERVSYVDLIRQIRDVVGARTCIVHIPYRLFWWMLRVHALFDSAPPFTVHQLEALIIPEEFPVTDWPRLFGVTPTPLRQALAETYLDRAHSDIVLAF
ncbi:NAD-dependent epimerase/dehydratase family protein [Dongia sp.]|uniref:NAD-dependent epimerase/dehydratase family protein n=1 Tax=Dongia sp. TaxID=1977262 RepID=UPI0035B33173